MNILLVNNDSDSWESLALLCKDCGWDTTPTHHSRLLDADLSQYDLVILSGGWWYDDESELLEKYAAELQIITTSNVPIFGICIGMQLMHVALDQAVPLMDAPEFGFRSITLTMRGQKLFGLPEKIPVFKNHTRAIIETDPAFEVLAYSPGHVEIMLHRSRPLMGIQFHPESDEDPERAVQLLKTLVGAVLRRR